MDFNFLREELEGQQRTRYVAAAGLAIVIYDTLLTLGDEVRGATQGVSCGLTLGRSSTFGRALGHYHDHYSLWYAFYTFPDTSRPPTHNPRTVIFHLLFYRTLREIGTFQVLTF